VGSTSFSRDLFGAACFVVVLFGGADFVASPFLSGPFWCEFQENNFFLFSIFFNL